METSMAMGKKIIKVLTAGSFDILHIGHINILKQSKTLGDELTVLISTDFLIEKYKGIKPIIPFQERMELIKAIKYVDYVFPQFELLPCRLIDYLQPDIITIGSDWYNKKLEGLEYAKNKGIKIAYFPYTESVSSTAIKNRIIRYSKQIQEAQIKKAGRGILK